MSAGCVCDVTDLNTTNVYLFDQEGARRLLAISLCFLNYSQINVVSKSAQSLRCQPSKITRNRFVRAATAAVRSRFHVSLGIDFQSSQGSPTNCYTIGARYHHGEQQQSSTAHCHNGRPSRSGSRHQRRAICKRRFEDLIRRSAIPCRAAVRMNERLCQTTLSNDPVDQCEYYTDGMIQGNCRRRECNSLLSLTRSHRRRLLRSTPNGPRLVYQLQEASAR